MKPARWLRFFWPQGGAAPGAHGCEVSGATPVITTASDVIGGLSLDMLEERFGWVAEPVERLKTAALALVNGEPVAIIQEVGSTGSWLDTLVLPAHVTFVRQVTQLPPQRFHSVVWITDRLVTDLHGWRPNASSGTVPGVWCCAGRQRGIPVEALADGLASCNRPVWRQRVLPPWPA